MGLISKAFYFFLVFIVLSSCTKTSDLSLQCHKQRDIKTWAYHSECTNENRAPASPQEVIDLQLEDQAITKIVKSVEEYLFKGGILLKNTAVNSLVFNANQLGLTFGSDRGIISQVIFWIDREVIANPFRVSKDDVYLAVDSLNIGFRLGAGVVVSGDVAFVKRFKAIYPVKEKRDAFYRPFYPLTVFNSENHNNTYWPDDLIIIHDNFYEGRGRLKINDLVLINPINLELTGSRIYIDRKIMFKNNGIESHVDFNAENRAAIDLSLKLGLQIPLFHGNMSHGDLKRSSYYFPFNSLGSFEKQVADDFNMFLMAKRSKAPQKYLQPEKVSTDFIKRFTNLSFFNLFSYDNHERSELIKVINTENKPIYQYQAVSQTANQWKNPFNLASIRQSLSSLFVSATNENKTNLSHPTIYLDILDFNSKTKKEVLDEGYIDALSEFTSDKNFLSSHIFSLTNPNQSIDSVLTDIRIEYYQESIDKILKLTIRDLDRTIAQTLNMKEREWKNFRLNARSSLNSDRNGFRGVRSSDHAYYVIIANQQRDFIKNLEKIKKQKTAVDKMDLYNKGLRRTVFKAHGRYSLVLISAITKHLDLSDFYLKANISLGQLTDNQSLDISNEHGIPREKIYKIHSFDTELTYYFYQVLKRH